MERIVWLGEDEEHDGDIDTAVMLIPKLLNLRSLEELLCSDSKQSDASTCWSCFGYLLQKPWFTRRWVIQEIAHARQVPVRLRGHVLSWVDFTEAVDIYLHSMDRVQLLHEQADSCWLNPGVMSSLDYPHARLLMDLSRSMFRKSANSDKVTRLNNLESIVLAAASFEVSEVRDTMYALMFLAYDTQVGYNTADERKQQRFVITSDYSRHPVDLFSDFVQYSLRLSASLDIICRPWATWPHSNRSTLYLGRPLPTWVGVATFQKQARWGSVSIPATFIKHSEVLLGTHRRPIYNASRGMSMEAEVLHLGNTTLRVKGVFLGQVDQVSPYTWGDYVVRETLSILGYRGEPQDGFDDNIWKSLVADRDISGNMAPTWYRRACSMALTHLDEKGALDIPRLLTNSSTPNSMKEYLKRVQSVITGRKTFNMEYLLHDYSEIRVSDTTPQGTCGVGPVDLMSGDCLFILAGCSVPVALRYMHSTGYELIGPCYVNGLMEGEQTAGLTPSQITEKSCFIAIL